MSFFQETTLTASNLTDSPYLVSYSVYGYNLKGAKVSGHAGKFEIQGREKVITGLSLETFGNSLKSPSLSPELKASSFALEVELEK